VQHRKTYNASVVLSMALYKYALPPGKCLFPVTAEILKSVNAFILCFGDRKLLLARCHD